MNYKQTMSVMCFVIIRVVYFVTSFLNAIYVLEIIMAIIFWKKKVTDEMKGTKHFAWRKVFRNHNLNIIDILNVLVRLRTF